MHVFMLSQPNQCHTVTSRINRLQCILQLREESLIIREFAVCRKLQMFCSFVTDIITCNRIVKTYVTSQLLIYLSIILLYTQSFIALTSMCMIIDWLYLLYIYNHHLLLRFKVCKLAGSFKCFAPSSPILLSVIGLSKTYVTSLLLIYYLSIILLYTQSFIVLISMCMIIDWLYLLYKYNHHLHSRFKVCKFAGSFKYFAPSAPI